MGVCGGAPSEGPGGIAPVRAREGKSSESVQCAMLKASDACADMGQL